MKLVTLALAALTATTTAQGLLPYYDVQSSAFRLVLRSANATLDGSLLGACHQGAAIEGLCLTSETLNDTAVDYATVFYHNVSSSDPANADETPGVLSYILSTAQDLNISSAMEFSPNVGSNIDNLIFSPGWDDFTTMAFDNCSSMYVPVYQDDTVSPPTYYQPTLQLKNWYVCLTRYSYLYESLVFKVGVTGEPQNPTCVPVEVERVFL